MLLIVAVGSNYALFFDRQAHRHDADGEALTLASLVIANASTVIGFGLLSFSQVPVLVALGTTVAPGTFLALLFAAVLARPDVRMRSISMRCPFHSRGADAHDMVARSLSPRSGLPRCRFRASRAPAAQAARSDVCRLGNASMSTIAAPSIGCDPTSYCRRVRPAFRSGWAEFRWAGCLRSTTPASHPGEIDGLCLLAPYLGNRMLTTEIAQIAGTCRAGSRANLRKPTKNAEYGVISSAAAPNRELCTWVLGTKIDSRRRTSCWRQRCRPTRLT